MLLGVAYAIPHRLKSRFPQEFAQLQAAEATASTKERISIVLRTGDPALRFYVHVQQSGFYVWAIGMIAFTALLLLGD